MFFSASEYLYSCADFFFSFHLPVLRNPSKDKKILKLLPNCWMVRSCIFFFFFPLLFSSFLLPPSLPFVKDHEQHITELSESATVLIAVISLPWTAKGTLGTSWSANIPLILKPGAFIPDFEFLDVMLFVHDPFSTHQ